MAKWIGCAMTIKSIDWAMGFYLMEEDTGEALTVSGGWSWFEDMIEDFSSFMSDFAPATQDELISLLLQ